MLDCVAGHCDDSSELVDGLIYFVVCKSYLWCNHHYRTLDCSGQYIHEIEDAVTHEEAPLKLNTIDLMLVEQIEHEDSENSMSHITT